MTGGHPLPPVLDYAKATTIQTQFFDTSNGPLPRKPRTPLAFTQHLGCSGPGVGIILGSRRMSRGMRGSTSRREGRVAAIGVCDRGRGEGQVAARKSGVLPADTGNVAGKTWNTLRRATCSPQIRIFTSCIYGRGTSSLYPSSADPMIWNYNFGTRWNATSTALLAEDLG